MMVREFEEKGVPFQYHEIANGGHGLGGGKPEEIENSYRRAFEFLEASSGKTLTVARA
jgi:hypothetical protein